MLRAAGIAFVFLELGKYFGNKVFRPRVENEMVPEVLMVRSGIKFNSNMMIPWANKVNELMANPNYQKLVQDLSLNHGLAGY